MPLIYAKCSVFGKSPAGLIVLPALGVPDIAVVHRESDIEITLLHELVDLGALNSVLQHYAVVKRVLKLEGIDPEADSDASVEDLFAGDLEIGRAIIKAGLEIALFHLCIIEYLVFG